MSRPTARATAVQVGEFLAGVAATYIAVGAAWTVTGAIWAAILVAGALIAVAAVAEVRLGPRATGFLAGVLPTAVVTAGLLAVLSSVLGRLES